MVDQVLGTFTAQGAWNRIVGVTTTVGDFDSVYEPGRNNGAQGENVHIRKPDGTIVPVHTPALADWRLTVQDGKLAIRWTKIVGANKELHLMITDIPAGQLAGATNTGTNPPVGGGSDMSPDQVRTIVREEVKPVLGSLDQTWSDLKTRISAIPTTGFTAGISQEEMAQIAQQAADRVLLGEPAWDHYNLPENARKGTRFQETIAELLFDPRFMEAFFLRVGEIVADMKARNVQIPGV